MEHGERILAYDENIAPEQEALLRGHNFREYPTIQELSWSKGSANSALVQEESAKTTENGGVRDEGSRRVGDMEGGDLRFREDDDYDLLFSEGGDIEAVKDEVLEYFHRAVEGNERGKRLAIGKLTPEGRKYLESVSGLTFKKDVDFVLNPSDLRHIHNDHYGDNEKDKGNNIPLTDEDIRKMVDVLSNPERVVFGIDKKTGNKVFVFLSGNPNGTYNLAEVYTDRRGNLTAKSFYNTKKTISQRVNELLTSSPRLTSATEGASSSSGAKIPTLFDISKERDEKSSVELNAMRERAEQMGAKIGTRVNVVEDVNDIVKAVEEKLA